MSTMPRMPGIVNGSSYGRRRALVLVAFALVALVMATSAASAYVLLNPPRKWFSTPRLVHVHSGGSASVVAPDPDKGVTATLGAVTAWNSGGVNPTSSVADTTGIVLGDGRSNLVFNDPIGVCSGSCIAATFTGYYNTGQQGTCGSLNVVAITDSDVVFNTAYNYQTVAEGSPCSNEIYLESVVTHEIGHLIGLGHSGNASALMAPTLSYCVNKPLHSDDLAGRNALYNCGGGGGCLPRGASCNVNSDCCSNSCRPNRKTCR